MAPWIESHTELGDHPKTKRLARGLRISLVQAVGHLHFLWWWALSYAQHGDLAAFADQEVADACKWEGDPAALRRALTAAGFLDDGGAIHDWDAYTVRLMERRERTNAQSRVRMQAFRERQRNAQEVTQNVTRNGSSRYAPTVPDHTGPNQPSTTPIGGGPARKADASAPPADTAPVAPAPPAAQPAPPRGNPKVAAVIDALRAEGMTGTLKPADRQALTKTEYPAGEVASLYAAIYRGEYGDEFMHTGLSVANCVNRWMDGWQSHQAGHRAPDRRNGNGNGHAPDKTSALQKTLEVIGDELGFDPTAGGPGGGPGGGGAARRNGGAPDPAVGGGQAGGGLRPQLPRPPDD